MVNEVADNIAATLSNGCSRLNSAWCKDQQTVREIPPQIKIIKTNISLRNLTKTCTNGSFELKKTEA